ncbi:MAG: TerL protein [Proteobacteria bacterium]|nr:TerL protein [Pseudomonadota bacterium]
MQTAARSSAVQSFDWMAQDYSAVNRERLLRLALWSKNPALVQSSRDFYRHNIAQFIEDVGVTSDPRNALLVPPRPVLMPFLLFPKQREFVNWVLERAKNKEHGLCEKSRDCGISWLAMCLVGSLCLFNNNINIGIGSAKEDKIDRTGDPDTLLHKLRTFLASVPVQFRGGYDEKRDSAHLRVRIPATNSTVVGEAGRNIGRGGRTTLYIIDESAFLEFPELVEASLASNTDCRIDISSVRGMGNPFAIKRHSGKFPVFTFRHTDDPRKQGDWLKRMSDTLDPVTLGSEILIDYRASVEGALIPAEWVLASVDAHKKLGIEPVSGVFRAALDVADEGRDRCALAGRHGVVLQTLQSWSGKGSNLSATVSRAFALCEDNDYQTLLYDADGLGAGCRGIADELNKVRRETYKKMIFAGPFRGSATPFNPDRRVPNTQRTAGDFFANAKSQSYWSLRMRLETTFRALEGAPFDRDDILSISSDLAELDQLVNELIQPTYTINNAGKVLVDKSPNGTASPNLADAVAMCFSPWSSKGGWHDMRDFSATALRLGLGM